MASFSAIKAKGNSFCCYFWFGSKTSICNCSLEASHILLIVVGCFIFSLEAINILLIVVSCLCAVSPRSFDLLNSMIYDLKRSVDLRWFFDHRCYIHQFRCSFFQPGSYSNRVQLKKIEDIYEVEDTGLRMYNHRCFFIPFKVILTHDE